MKTKSIFKFAVLFFIIPFGLSAKCLTLSDVITIALDQNPASLAAEYGVLVAQETTEIARAFYDPEVTLHAGYNRFERFLFRPKISLTSPLPIVIPVQVTLPPTIGPYDDWSLGFLSRYIIYDSGKRKARLDGALALEGIACSDADRVRQAIILAVSIAYYNLLSTMDMIAAAKEQLARAERHYRIVQDLIEVGSATTYDLSRIEVQVAAAKQAVIHAETQFSIAKGNLNIAMGLPPYTCIDVASDQRMPIEPKDSWITEAYEEAYQHRPEIQNAVEKINVAKALVREAESEGGVKLTAEAGFGFRDTGFFPQHKEWIVGVQAAYPLYKGYGIVHAIRKAKNQLYAVEEEYARVKLQIDQEIWSSFARTKEVYELLDTIEAQVQAASEALIVSESRYQVGAGTLTELLDAQTALTTAEASHVEAEWSYFIALAAFRWSQGLDIVCSLDQQDVQDD